MTEEEEGLTPVALRGGGATWFYQATGDVPRFVWRGRRHLLSTLEYYIRAVAGQNFLARLAACDRARILELAELAQLALEHEFQLLC